MNKEVSTADEGKRDVIVTLDIRGPHYGKHTSVLLTAMEAERIWNMLDSLKVGIKSCPDKGKGDFYLVRQMYNNGKIVVQKTVIPNSKRYRRSRKST